MKTFIFALAISFAVTMVQADCIIAVRGDQIVTPKYVSTVGGTPYWTDEDVAQAEAMDVVDTGTGTAKNFKEYVCPDQDIIDEINAEGGVDSRAKADAKITLLKSKSYNIEEGAKLEAGIKQITDFGQANAISVVSTTKTYEPKLKLYRNRSK